MFFQEGRCAGIGDPDRGVACTVDGLHRLVSVSLLQSPVPGVLGDKKIGFRSSAESTLCNRVLSCDNQPQRTESLCFLGACNSTFAAVNTGIERGLDLVLMILPLIDFNGSA